ncbi:Glycosyl transferase family 2 [Pedobacter westerhofensis]|uniref:Glycosyl transferase family 2 n=1 Tax=Pedobacter westerhofensis TaxID=425512 RepID=A0A521FRT2_9SPHI|nr:glycosyltransferase family A protein [Pedobacter westerhofensis]SMO98852.1 Glycosyl transferase family 2 [Pedobacter westerhofensis]
MSDYHVSCIMPTANRELYIPLAVDYFLNQSYRNAELIIVDDGKNSVKHLLPNHYRIKYFYTAPLGSIGLKRNYACLRAAGKIIVHWDDDDWYGQEWITRQVRALETSGADICGLNQITFYSPLVQKYWRYDGEDKERPWLAGATMAYWKSFWVKHPFKDLHIGEDYDYIWNNQAKIYAHDYVDGFYATLHAKNTTLKPFENKRHKKHAIKYMDVPYNGNAENPE